MHGTRAFEIGGVRLAVRLDGGDLALKFPAVMAPFAVDDDRRPHITAVVRGADLRDTAPAVAPAFDFGHVWCMYRHGDRQSFRFTSPAFGATPYRVAHVDDAADRVDVLVHADYFDGPMYPLEYPLDELLVIGALARASGMEVHSCGVVDQDGRGHLFVGQSGAGKTTTARLWLAAAGGGAVVLSDDRVILRREAGAIWMYGTPWHGEAGIAAASRAPLATVHFLRHAQEPDNVWTALPEPLAAARLLACSFAPVWLPERAAAVVDLAVEVVSRVPCGELSFVPDARVVEFVRRR